MTIGDLGATFNEGSCSEATRHPKMAPAKPPRLGGPQRKVGFSGGFLWDVAEMMKDMINWFS